MLYILGSDYRRHLGPYLNSKEQAAERLDDKVQPVTKRAFDHNDVSQELLSYYVYLHSRRTLVGRGHNYADPWVHVFRCIIYLVIASCSLHYSLRSKATFKKVDWLSFGFFRFDWSDKLKRQRWCSIYCTWLCSLVLFSWLSTNLHWPSRDSQSRSITVVSVTVF